MANVLLLVKVYGMKKIQSYLSCVFIELKTLPFKYENDLFEWKAFVVSDSGNHLSNEQMSCWFLEGFFNHDVVAGQKT